MSARSERSGARASSTKIDFEIVKASNTRIIIYDALGREIETLFSEKLAPGKYTADWNASNRSSGVYFYRLITDNFSETKKMILTK